MGSTYGQKSTMGASDNNLHIAIEDQVVKFPKLRRELINRLDGSNFKNEVVSHKYEWSTRDNRKLQTKIDAPLTNTATTLIAHDEGVFNVDDVFQMVGGAQFVVESVAGGVQVTFRNLTGTQVAQLANADIVIVGSATPQGKDADNMVVKGFDDYYNFTSNFEDVVDMSDMENAAMIRGEQSSADIIAAKEMELTEKLQRTILMGVRYQDKTRKITMAGGLKNLIDLYAPNNAIDFGAPDWTSDLEIEDKIDDMLDIIAEKAFKKPVMYVSAKFMKKFKHVQETQFRSTPDTTKRGIGVVKIYNSHTFGEIEVVQLQGIGHLMDDLIFMVDESQFGYKAHKGLAWHTYPLARKGQSFQWQVAGVYTIKLDIPEAAVYAHNLGL